MLQTETLSSFLIWVSIPISVVVVLVADEDPGGVAYCGLSPLGPPSKPLAPAPPWVSHLNKQELVLLSLSLRLPPPCSQCHLQEHVPGSGHMVTRKELTHAQHVKSGMHPNKEIFISEFLKQSNTFPPCINLPSSRGADVYILLYTIYPIV